MTLTGKPSLLICYDHFYPAYKAGGPIQSLTNLALRLQSDHEIFVLTSGFDLNDTRPLPAVKFDQWSDVDLPASTVPLKVWYASSGRPGIKEMRKILSEISPVCIYLNGMFSWQFVIVPLLAKKKYQAVICPRGMLQQGALAGKSLKKKVYLSALKLSGLCRNVRWHATDGEEEADIRQIFGRQAAVIIAGNIPRKPVDDFEKTAKSAGRLRLVYLSLISSKKNLLPLLEIISSSPDEVTLHIYGPVKDESYWKRCRVIIDSNPGRIVYKGDVSPATVQQVFTGYDASVLLTKGENFGHALYESLSAGRPVITSWFTPWKDLEKKKAGWNVNINDEKEIKAVLNKICNMPAGEFERYCTGAYTLAAGYFLQATATNAYNELFNDLKRPGDKQ